MSAISTQDTGSAGAGQGSELCPGLDSAPQQMDSGPTVAMDETLLPILAGNTLFQGLTEAQLRFVLPLVTPEEHP
ncbi:MAG TPA: hypothetical protein VMF68_00590, partial [Spirochaetia bacterium]|nr:hypothetical protein [Spirochaetia bacterium]